MTQNPYAQFGSPAQREGGNERSGFDSGHYPAPLRTSFLAICSLVLAILCFLPFTGALAIICGGAAILFISSSRGRLGGLGLAISGILIGLFTSVFWVFIIVGAITAQQQMGGTLVIGPSTKMFQDLDSGDYAAARANFSPILEAAVTDEQLAAFVAAYQAEVGTYQSTPQKFFPWIKAIFQLLPQMERADQATDGFPLPVTFTKQQALVFIGLPGQTVSPGQPLPPTENIGVIIAPGRDIWLLDPATNLPVDHSAAKKPASTP